MPEFCCTIKNDLSKLGLDHHELQFVHAYLECIAFTEQCPIGADVKFAESTLRQIIEDCLGFIQSASEIGIDLTGDMERAGHDFWLTRNSHGAGFWDGGWENETGEKLTELSKPYGSFDVYPTYNNGTGVRQHPSGEYNYREGSLIVFRS